MAPQVWHLVVRWRDVLGYPFSLIVPLDQNVGFSEGDSLVWLLESAARLGDKAPNKRTSPCRGHKPKKTSPKL